AARDAREALLSFLDQPDGDGKRSANSAARNRAIVRCPYSGLFELHDAGDRRRDAVPVGGLFFQLLPSQPRERVELGATIVFARLPMRANPSAMFELMECGVKRTVADAQHLAGHLFQTLADGPSIQGFQCQYFEDQHVQRPLDQVGRLTHKGLLSVTELDYRGSPRLARDRPKVRLISGWQRGINPVGNGARSVMGRSALLRSTSGLPVRTRDQCVQSRSSALCPPRNRFAIFRLRKL